MEEFERAKDKIMMGAERRSMVMSEEEKRMTAYHEAGHAIVGLSCPSTIRSTRSRSSRAAARSASRSSCRSRTATASIEASAHREHDRDAVRRPHRRGADLRQDAVTTGASNDIERATDLARNMVTKWGLSDRSGR
jgi:cell division protease FtsH